MLIPTKTLNPALHRFSNISLLIYPVVAHIGVLMDQIIFSAYYLIIVIFLNSVNSLPHNKVLNMLLILIMSAFFYIIFKSELLIFIIFIPPVLIPCWLAFIFLRSLRENEAVITTIARKIEGKDLDSRHLLYTRHLTFLWGIAFLLMIVEAITLAIWAPYKVWSWWVHVGNYIIVAALFFIEILVRHKFTGQRTQVFNFFRVLLQRNWHD